MKTGILKKLPSVLSSAYKLNFTTRQKWFSLFHGNGVEHIRRTLCRPACYITYHGSRSLMRGLVLHSLTPLSVSSPHLCWRCISVDVKNVFSDDDGDDNEDDEDRPDDKSNKIRKILGSKTLTDFKERCMDLDLKMTLEDWQNLEDQVLLENPAAERAWKATCLQLISAAKNMELAESYMCYVRSKGSPTHSILATFIAMCGRCCGKKKQELIFEAYNEILKISDLFDSMTAKCLIQGFSETDRWRECLGFIEMAKLADSPTSAYYSPVVCAALREGDTDLAFSLLNTMGEEGMKPKENVCLEFVRKIKDSESGVTVDIFMDFLRKYNWMMREETILLLKEYFKGSPNKKYKTTLTQVNKWGMCQSCKQHLKRLELSDAEFELLQREMLENVLIGDNVYLQSSPAEVEHFKDFVQENAPFDVVIDALNVAYSNMSGGHVKKPNSLFLKKVVEHFARFQHQRVLVIGRQHMKAGRDMRYIERLARTFYTDNSSKDDPFSLYAALYSGKSCLILSNDHMKDHKFKLGPHMKESFEQWQRSHQITNCFLTDRGRMYVEMPVKHETGPQKNAKGWHIPYEDESERPVYQRPTTWLCVQEIGSRSPKKKNF